MFDVHTTIDYFEVHTAPLKISGDDVRAIIQEARNNKLHAIQDLRHRYQLSLKDAKEIIETLI